MKHKKKETITFKVDTALAELLESVPNKSEFIRNSLIKAFEKSCPLCLGSGILTPEQCNHWAAFVTDHTVTRCEECNALHLVCDAHKEKAAH